MSRVSSVTWCVLCGVKVPRGGSDKLPVLIDVCEYNLVERCEGTGCVGRSEVFGWLCTILYGEMLLLSASGLGIHLTSQYKERFLAFV
jgi:hypothetical protein